LSDVLISLKEKYNYDFTYAHDIINGIFVKPPPSTFNIKESINYLSIETHLVFQFQKNNIITINAREIVSYICGYVIDNETKIPIENVSIISANNHTTSDIFGYFKLRINEFNENISVRHLGYVPFQKVANSFEQENCLNIYLSSQTETLSEIVIANYITKGIDKLTDGSLAVNFSDFGIIPGLIETDVLQTVQALPGIQSANETVSDINIRGGTHDQNLILWDDIKMYQSGHFFGLISIFNPLITTNASIIKNGTTVDLTDGVSGTISMNTNTNINDTFEGSIGSNFINVDGFVDIPLSKKSSLQLAARKAISDLVKTPTYTQYFDRILQNTEVQNNVDEVINTDVKFDFYDTSLRWLYNITDKDQLRINFLNVDNELVFNESPLINQDGSTKESSIVQYSIIGGIFYKRNWTSRFTTSFDISETYYELESINEDILKQRRLKQENEVSETSIKLKASYKSNNELSILNGYHFTETIVSNLTDLNNPIVLQLNKEVIREHAVFSQFNYLSKSKKTTIQAGLRYNYIEKFKKLILEPRLSFNQKLFSHFNFEILGEYKHQNTSQIVSFQSDFLGIENRRWLLSNNVDIPIIKSKQVSVGLNYNHNGWLLSTEGYFKEVNGITSQSQGFLNQYIFSRTNGNYKVKGIDVLVNKRFKKLSTWLSYSYADNEYTFKELQALKFPNNLDVTHAITFGSSFTTNNFKISAGFNWHSGKPTTLPVIGNEIVNNQINYQDSNSSRLKEYLRIDASATYRFKITNKISAQTGISIWNSSNHKNIINNYYTIDSDNTIQEVTNKALNFTPNFSFRVLF